MTDGGKPQLPAVPPPPVPGNLSLTRTYPEQMPAPRVLGRVPSAMIHALSRGLPILAGAVLRDGRRCVLATTRVFCAIRAYAHGHSGMRYDADMERHARRRHPYCTKDPTVAASVDAPNLEDPVTAAVYLMWIGRRFGRDEAPRIEAEPLWDALEDGQWSAAESEMLASLLERVVLTIEEHPGELIVQHDHLRQALLDTRDPR